MRSSSPTLDGEKPYEARILVVAAIVGLAAALLARWILGAVVGGVWRPVLTILDFVAAFNAAGVVQYALMAKRRGGSGSTSA